MIPTVPVTWCNRPECDCPWDCAPASVRRREVEIHVGATEDTRGIALAPESPAGDRS